MVGTLVVLMWDSIMNLGLMKLEVDQVVQHCSMKLTQHPPYLQSAVHRVRTDQLIPCLRIVGLKWKATAVLVPTTAMVLQVMDHLFTLVSSPDG